MATPSAEQRTAVIDLGSNSFRLVVFTAADGWWKRTDEIYEAVRIGAGLGETGELGDEPMQRALHTIDVFAHFSRALGERLAVARVADRARRHGAHVGDVQRPAEVREHVDGVQSALHRLLAELARLAEARADAHGLVDLVRALPPAVGRREDDEAEGVRPEIDDRGALLGGGDRHARGTVDHRAAQAYGSPMPESDQSVADHIEGLVAEEHKLLERGGAEGGLKPDEHARLEEVRVELDRLWDLMRQRRALRNAGQDPDDASERDAGTVENYLG